jgi:hypothetical protein
MNRNTRAALLDARAERGIPRGPDAVWRAAEQLSSEERQNSEHRAGGADLWSTRWFRFAMVVCLLGLGGLLFQTRPTSNDVGGEGDSDVGGEQQNDATDEVPTPARILVGDLQMQHVQLPIDPDAPIDPHYIRRLAGTETITGLPDEGEPVETVFFADPSSPFTNPILGLELLAGGGFQPFGVNLGGVTLESLTEFLVRSDGDWTVTEESGLVEVARFTESPFDMLRFGWQFDFGSSPNQVTWQAEPHDGSGVWVWIARLAGPDGGPTSFTLRQMEVLGQPGLILEQSPDAGGPSSGFADDEVIWVDDGYVYRLTAGDSFGRSASVAAPELRIVDAAQWDDSMADANRWFGAGPGIQLDVAVLALWLVTALYLIIRGPRLPLALPLLAGALWWALGPDLWLTLVLVGGLAALWWWLLRRRQPPAPVA